MTETLSAKKPSTGRSYWDLIKDALQTLQGSECSSRQAIDKHVAAVKGEGYSKARLNMALKRGVETGKVVTVKGSFKLSPLETASKTKAKGRAKSNSMDSDAPGKKRVMAKKGKDATPAGRKTTATEKKSTSKKATDAAPSTVRKGKTRKMSA